jgi:DNA-binding NarL/FixJ family response regulator
VSSYHIVLVDDHAMFRQGVMSILAGSEDLEIVGEVGDGLAFLKLLKKLTPQMVILDISMPHLRGIEAIPEAKTIHPELKILILSMHKEKEYVYKSISSGADGYLLKENAVTELFAAIETIRRGKCYISPLLSGELTHDLIKARHTGQVPLPIDSLTTREREVLKLIAEGISNKKIADFLCISIRTVEHHRANIMKKLNIGQTANLVKYAISKGYTFPTI